MTVLYCTQVVLLDSPPSWWFSVAFFLWIWISCGLFAFEFVCCLGILNSCWPFSIYSTDLFMPLAFPLFWRFSVAISYALGFRLRADGFPLRLRVGSIFWILADGFPLCFGHSVGFYFVMMACRFICVLNLTCLGAADFSLRLRAAFDFWICPAGFPLSSVSAVGFAFVRIVCRCLCMFPLAF